LDQRIRILLGCLRRFARKSCAGRIPFPVSGRNRDKLHQLERNLIPVLGGAFFARIFARINGRLRFLWRHIPLFHIAHNPLRSFRAQRDTLLSDELRPPASLMPVNARRFIRKMRGGAQAHLLEADDGNCYVVKFQNNPQHRRILVNELIAAEILTHLQVASPDYRLVRVSTEFLASSPDVHIQTGSRRVDIEPGWHFGSRHPGHPDTMAIYDFVPDALLGQIANAEQFLAALVFDRWVGNADGRQTIFFRAQLKDWMGRPGIPPRKLGFVALMIDHGFAFNGPHWELTESALTGLYARRMVYQTVRSIQDFEPWLTRVLRFPPEVLDKALRQIPPEWVQGDEPALERLLEGLLRRRARIAELMDGCRKAPGNPFPNWP
jgi:hypothetical protein